MRDNGRGFSLVEILIAIMILSVTFMALLKGLGSVSRARLSSKTRSAAKDLVNDKLESMKDIPYHQLIVTTKSLTAREPGLKSYSYDEEAYPPEKLSMNGASFERRIFVEKVHVDPVQKRIKGLLPGAPDTGFKRTTVFVIWKSRAQWQMTKMEDIVYVDSLLVPRGGTQNYGWLTGVVKARGKVIRTGVLIFATQEKIKDMPPDITHALRMGPQKYYSASSGSDGTYRIYVPGQTASLYNVYAWYTPDTRIPSRVIRKSKRVSVKKKQETKGVDFSWP